MKYKLFNENNQKLFYIVITVLIAIFVIFINVNNIKSLLHKINFTFSNNPKVKGAVIEEKSPVYLSNYKVPILMYHYIRYNDDPENSVGYKLSVSPDNFSEQLDWLKNNNFNTVDFRYLEKPYEVDFKPIIITFDDGYIDAYTNAYRILKDHNMKGVFYVITDSVGYPAYLNWDMIKEMKDNGMQFGSHSLSHPDLTKLGDEGLDAQLRFSNHDLKDKADIDVFDFCYPSGKYDERTIVKLKELGYKTATTTNNGIASESSNIFELPRIRVQEYTNFDEKLSNY